MNRTGAESTQAEKQQRTELNDCAAGIGMKEATKQADNSNICRL